MEKATKVCSYYENECVLWGSEGISKIKKYNFTPMRTNR